MKKKPYKPAKPLGLSAINHLKPQAVFDFVARHLLGQKVRAFDGDSCVYRQLAFTPGAPPLMCAVGCLISDDEFVKVAALDCNDGTSFQALVRALDLEKPLHFNLLDELQDVHDGTDPRLWPRELAKVAKAHGLRFKDSTP